MTKVRFHAYYATLQEYFIFRYMLAIVFRIKQEIQRIKHEILCIMGDKRQLQALEATPLDLESD